MIDANQECIYFTRSLKLSSVCCDFDKANIFPAPSLMGIKNGENILFLFLKHMHGNYLLYTSNILSSLQLKPDRFIFPLYLTICRPVCCLKLFKIRRQVAQVYKSAFESLWSACHTKSEHYEITVNFSALSIYTS